jgi:hypothetical protein
MLDSDAPTGDPSYPGPMFGPPKPLRRGSISERYVKCGKPGCPCAEDPAARHGPYPSMAFVVDGRTRTRHLSEEEAEVASRQIEDGRRIREEFEAYLAECERCADAELEAVRKARTKKGGSRRRSRRQLRPKSTG